MKASKFLATMMLGAALIMVGCGQSSSDDDTSIASRSGRAGTTGSGTFETEDNGVYFYTAEKGSITPVSGVGITFEKLIKNLLSAAMEVNSDTVGSINSNAVTFQGRVELLDLGNGTIGVDENHSAVVITIDDSISKNGGEPLKIAFNGNDARVTSSGGNRYSVTFEDAYGTITFNGAVSGSTFSGSFDFKNAENIHYATSSMKFSVPTCGFFVCKR